MLTKKIQYDGNNIFNINFGLYNYEDIDFEKSKKEILDSFKIDFKSKLKAVLKTIGLKYCSLIYYSPKFYRDNRYKEGVKNE